VAFRMALRSQRQHCSSIRKPSGCGPSAFEVLSWRKPGRNAQLSRIARPVRTGRDEAAWITLSIPAYPSV
jgi:hypothetical protein